MSQFQLMLRKNCINYKKLIFSVDKPLFLKVEVSNLVMEDSTVIGLLDHVAGYTIGKSCLGPVQGWLGGVRNQAGEG